MTMKRGLIAGALAALLAVGAWLYFANADAETLEIETVSGERISFTIELADSGRERERGLMFRESLPDRHGMLFDFGPPREIRMWMKNTLIPLDMIFIKPDGTIHRVASMTVPFSLDTVASNGDVSAVLEIAGGTATALGITEGATVHHPIFGNE